MMDYVSSVQKDKCRCVQTERNIIILHRKLVSTFYEPTNTECAPSTAASDAVIYAI